MYAPSHAIQTWDTKECSCYVKQECRNLPFRSICILSKAENRHCPPALVWFAQLNREQGLGVRYGWIRLPGNG